MCLYTISFLGSLPNCLTRELSCFDSTYLPSGLMSVTETSYALGARLVLLFTNDALRRDWENFLLVRFG